MTPKKDHETLRASVDHGNIYFLNCFDKDIALFQQNASYLESWPSIVVPIIHVSMFEDEHSSSHLALPETVIPKSYILLDFDPCDRLAFYK